MARYLKYIKTNISLRKISQSQGHKCDILIFFFTHVPTQYIVGNVNDTYSRYSKYVHTYIVHEYMVGIHLIAVPNVKK